jgi:glutaredoxin
VSRLTLYTRDGCHLCEELRAELAPWAARRGVAVEVLDVDADPDSQRRYGHRVPVLMLDGETVAHGRVSLDALDGLWEATGRGRGEGTRLL